MIDRPKRLEYEKVSLSVDPDNYAFRLYRNSGFETVETKDGSATMVKILK